ncbi:hypothetical protein [Amycolatopsis camponoti]|uniref:hypothetical protein n=1 Tax=Amycolatopsis camponoti TaxID=2606593 RepID=UPI0012D74309|nr:hypothetical protein [Amycolatopsis camponoti]
MFEQFDSTNDQAVGLITDPIRRESVLNRLSAGMDESLAQEARLHGWRVQALFEAMATHLRHVSIVKQEDVGSYHFDDINGSVKPPDFRIVTDKREQLLVEVKNVAPKYKEKSQKIRASDLDQEKRYADLTSSRLLYAHYWSHINIWTLIDPAVLQREGRDYALDFPTAMKANELFILGDLLISLRPPITATFVVDGGQFLNGIAQATLTDWWMSSGDQVIRNELERTILWKFYSLHKPGWTTDCKVENDTMGRIREARLVQTPLESQVCDRGFAQVAWLSRIFSAAYNEATITSDGQVKKFRHQPEGWLSAIMAHDLGEIEFAGTRLRPSLGPAAR